MPQAVACGGLVGALLLAGISCGPAETHTPTPTATHSPDPTSTRSPTPTATPTVASTSTANATPASMATATPTEPPEDLAPSRLLGTLERLPLSFREEGVWFNHYIGRALELAGAPRPRNLAEFNAWDEAQQEAYWEASRGVAIFPRLLGRVNNPDWGETFGFDRFSLDLAVGTGADHNYPLAPTYLEGEFDESLIRDRLLDLGYQELSAAGLTYYAIRDDYDAGSLDPASRLALNSMNRVFVGEGVLIAVPATDIMTSILEAWAGMAPSLAEDPALSSLARALGDPLAAALLTRSVALKVIIEPTALEHLEEYEKPAEWGTLHSWEVLGAGAGMDSGGRWMAFSLYYSDPDAAAADAEELVQRMEGYTTLVPQLYSTNETLVASWPEHPLELSCRSLSTSVRRDIRGSTLTVRCPLTESPVEWVQLVFFRDLGFLVP